MYSFSQVIGPDPLGPQPLTAIPVSKFKRPSVSVHILSPQRCYPP